jgi:hypothetical protein
MCSHAWTPFVSVAVTAGAAKARPVMVSRNTGKETPMRNLLIVEVDTVWATISIF